MLTEPPRVKLFAVHLIPVEQAGRRVIDETRVCQAIAAVSAVEDPDGSARRFAILGEPGRLSLLVAMRHAGPIAVTDLSVATGISETGVSQALRIMRANGIVTSARDGRVVRYRIADTEVSALIGRLAPKRLARAASTPR
jgi:DNA-binding transcriptional ArsR family regulator